MRTTMQSPNTPSHARRFFTGGLVASIASAILNNMYGLFYCAVTQIIVPPQLMHWRMTLTSTLTCMGVTTVYFVMTRMTMHANTLFYGLGTIAFFMSLSAPLGETLEGIPELVVPMHIATALVMLVVLPRFAQATDEIQDP